MIEKFLFDLGGYKTFDGKVTKHGVFYRSKALDKITQQDIETLRGLKIKNIIDFRPGDYVTLYPDKILHIPDFVYWNFQMVLTPKIIQDYFGKKFSRTDVAKSYLDLNPSSVRCTFNIKYETIVNSKYDNEAFLLHCNNGRSRAGLLCALLLGMCNVSQEDIEKNYVSIHDVMTASIPSVELFRKDSADMKSILNHLKDNYGGIEMYLTSFCRIPNNWLDTIKTIFLM